MPYVTKLELCQFLGRSSEWVQYIKNKGLLDGISHYEDGRLMVDSHQLTDRLVRYYTRLRDSPAMRAARLKRIQIQDELLELKLERLRNGEGRTYPVYRQSRSFLRRRS